VHWKVTRSELLVSKTTMALMMTEQLMQVSKSLWRAL
tara:strand:+ start:621 stop:731 length:111 start_codon:yes stop_codon:yes gene_type:complete